MEYPSLPQCLVQAVDRFQSSRAQLHKTGGEWKAISAQELLRRVAALSAAFAQIGIGEGDRVAIFAPNCPEWHSADFAVLGLGAVVVPIYFRESPDRLQYIANHAGVKAIFVAGKEQIERMAELGGRVPGVERVIVAGDEAATEGAVALPGALRYESIIAAATDFHVAAYRHRAAAIQSGQLASIIYTSGTTGEPKGVMLSHANFVSNQIASFKKFPLSTNDLALSVLPLAHVYERLTDYGYLFSGITMAYVSRPEDLVQSLVEVQPTVVAAVPRFFEKFYASILERGGQGTGVRKKLFSWGMNVARRAVPWRAYGKPAPAWLQLEWRLADRIVFRKLRAAVGGRIRIFISGGAPLARELAEFFTAVGLPIMQGYGLTETSPVIATNGVPENRVGTVGRPIRGVEVRIADDGEILVRGPCVMMGYYKRPEETRAAISPDGWFATGDIGHLDADGYLVITDRKKEMLKTAGGKLVAPAPIENALKQSPYILNAAVIGDQRRFIAALIVPNFGAVETRAKEAGLALHSPAEIAASAWTQQLIEAEIARLTGNLAQYESIKRFALIDHDFTFDSGELTYTLKLKRRVIGERYAAIIEALYAEASPVR